MNRYLSTLAVALVAAAGFAPAHDTWVQTNTNLVRTGDAVHIDLMLGNHGNDHRDFKLASKLSPDMIQSFEVIAPDGKKYDLKRDMTDLGYAPKEGFHSAKFVAAKPGLYVAAQTLDKVLNHGKPVRGYKPLGHKIELVPEVNPVVPMGPGTPIKVKLLFEGKPLDGVKVSFIPRGVTLKEGTDADYERTTDKNGKAAFTPKTGTYYLVVAHYPREEKGDGYESAHYTATLTVFVPEKCPCCGD